VVTVPQDLLQLETYAGNGTSKAVGLDSGFVQPIYSMFPNSPYPSFASSFAFEPYAQNIVFDGTQFVAFAGLSGAGQLTFATPSKLVSADGITWTNAGASTPMLLTGFTTRVAYGNGKFVAVPTGYTGSNVFSYSADGLTWTAGVLPSSHNWSDVIFANGLFIISSAGENYTFSFSSLDVYHLDRKTSSTCCAVQSFLL
jgi:hypothetical protein